MGEIITNVNENNEKNVKNNKNSKKIFLILTAIIIVIVSIFIRYNSSHKPEKFVKDYLHYKYDKYSDYAKISNIKQIYNGYKKEGKDNNKDVDEYVFEVTANYLGSNSDIFYITLWVNTKNGSFDIIEVDATKVKQDVYTGSLWPIYSYYYPYTSLWDKICPVIVSDLIDDSIDENFQVISNNESYTFKSQEQYKYFFDIIVPIDIKTEDSNTLSKYNQLFTKLYNFDKETDFVIKFNDLEVKLDDYFNKYNNFEDYIKGRD